MRNLSIYVESPRDIEDHCVARQADGQEIVTDCARAICGQWHAGQSSAFYAFASSGHYDRATLLRELSDIFAMPTTRLGDLPLNMLGTYLVNRSN